MGCIRLLLIAWIAITLGNCEISSPNEAKITKETNETTALQLSPPSNAASPDRAQRFPPLEGTGVYGKLGTNYFTDNGRPYINCIKRTKTEPDEKSVRCYLDLGRHRERLGCMTIFRYNGTDAQLKNDSNPGANLVITAQDCWQHEADVIESCSSEEKCVYKDNITASGLYFCCCNTHNCNDAVHLLPAELRNGSSGSTPSPNNKTKAYIIYVLLLAGIILMGASVLVLFMIHYYRRRGKVHKKGSVEDSTNLLDFKMSKMDMTPRLNLVSQWIELDKGHFAKVYKGQLIKKDGTIEDCALKVFTDNTDSFAMEKSIFQEIAARPIKNENIIQFIDWDTHGDRQSLIATRYEPLGNLKDYLARNVLNAQQSLRLLTSIMDGLAYLHEEKVHDGKFFPTICHRDIKGSNILLRYNDKKHLVGCICDFGLALKCDPISIRQLSGQAQVGTKRYMAPEVLEGATEFTQSAFRQIDVYAMALVMWEVVQRTQTHPNDQVPEFKQAYEEELGPVVGSINYIRAAVCQKKLRPIFRKEVVEHPLLGAVADAAQEMWYEESDARISAACALQRLRQLSGEDSEGYHSAIALNENAEYSEGTAMPSFADFESKTPQRSSAVIGNEEMELITR